MLLKNDMQVVPPEVYVLLGATATLSRFLVLNLQAILTKALGPTWETKKAVEAKRIPLHKRWYYNVYQNLTDIQGQDPVLIVAAATGFTGLFLGLSAVIQIVSLLWVMALCIRRARSSG